jgi:hypothetical protein
MAWIAVVPPSPATPTCATRTAPAALGRHLPHQAGRRGPGGASLNAADPSSKRVLSPSCGDASALPLPKLAFEDGFGMRPLVRAGVAYSVVLAERRQQIQA